MTDAHREWISKRAYALWEEAGRPHGLDAVHWAQAEQEHEAAGQNRPGSAATSTKAAKPLIEISPRDDAGKAPGAGATASRAKRTKTPATGQGPN
ncbi:DUF2934 domain-containing protein [Shinella daejeonensis]|uniref:DUF2934 domain-containing protein n=1 Tax=Shinella daejeonensis TaxID=659017 RepID=UPI0020C7EF51|nr:DUF2934 domain-containing protein [Shinella daejeonensis]MCP8895260.1 DUF2934 domain-containing protein [Shinella daejeonensis]